MSPCKLAVKTRKKCSTIFSLYRVFFNFRKLGKKQVGTTFLSIVIPKKQVFDEMSF